MNYGIIFKGWESVDTDDYVELLVFLKKQLQSKALSGVFKKNCSEYLCKNCFWFKITREEDDESLCNVLAGHQLGMYVSQLIELIEDELGRR